MADTGGGALPTGCFKCGRPGHWSRDCPSSKPNPNNSNLDSTSAPDFSTKYSKTSNGGGGNSNYQLKPTAKDSKPKKVPRTRPKVTPDLLLADEGLGYILRYFPRNFKFRGRGYEVNDLKNLLRMYAEWHEKFLPYFPFDQFIHKVEEAGSSKRLKSCIADLKERVANGGDPTKLKENNTKNEILNEQEDVRNMEAPTNNQEDLTFNGNCANDMEEDILNEMFNETLEETSITRQANNTSVGVLQSQKSTEQNDKPSSVGGGSSNPKITEEEKSLMEAKRQKALEKAAARRRLQPPS
ncbi:uncharacterized protein LOC130805919 [Amaranthus tricolor]|uniref:uncharacterized protein LOC130805919 n=1 Tax=Amaranthus tricolor TaxID=29722 RepID=UPI002587345A|nr:uncharacterized protein LOC130805919 [Amaranthus tricolor]